MSQTCFHGGVEVGRVGHDADDRLVRVQLLPDPLVLADIADDALDEDLVAEVRQPQRAQVEIGMDGRPVGAQQIDRQRADHAEGRLVGRGEMEQVGDLVTDQVGVVAAEQLVDGVLFELAGRVAGERQHGRVAEDEVPVDIVQEDWVRQVLEDLAVGLVGVGGRSLIVAGRRVR